MRKGLEFENLCISQTGHKANTFKISTAKTHSTNEQSNCLPTQSLIRPIQFFDIENSDQNPNETELRNEQAIPKTERNRRMSSGGGTRLGAATAKTSRQVSKSLCTGDVIFLGLRRAFLAALPLELVTLGSSQKSFPFRSARAVSIPINLRIPIPESQRPYGRTILYAKTMEYGNPSRGERRRRWWVWIEGVYEERETKGLVLVLVF